MPPYAEAAKAQMREAILDAAYDAIVARGWSGVRMADIAGRVGLSRQTLYNEYGTKEGLARSVVLREVRRFLDGIAEVHAAHPEPRAGIVASSLYTFARAADNPLLKAILTSSADGPDGDGRDGDGRDGDGRDGDGDLLPLLTTRGEPVMFAARDALAVHLQERWPDAPPAEVRAAAEVAVRLTISHLVLPADPPEVVARRLGRLIPAYLDAD